MMGGEKNFFASTLCEGKHGGGEFRETIRERNDDRTNERPDYKFNHART